MSNPRIEQVRFKCVSDEERAKRELGLTSYLRFEERERSAERLATITESLGNSAQQP